MMHRSAKGPSIGRVPELRRPGIVPRQDDPAVGAEGCGPAYVPGCNDTSNRLMDVGLPKPHREITTRGEERLSVRAEGHGDDRSLVLQSRTNRPTGERIPEPRRVVIAPGKEKFAIGADRDAPDPVAVSLNWRQKEFSVGRIK
jgi:hypothetical protein